MYFKLENIRHSCWRPTCDHFVKIKRCFIHSLLFVHVVYCYPLFSLSPFPGFRPYRLLTCSLISMEFSNCSLLYWRRQSSLCCVKWSLIDSPATMSLCMNVLIVALPRGWWRRCIIGYRFALILQFERSSDSLKYGQYPFSFQEDVNVTRQKLEETEARVYYHMWWFSKVAEQRLHVLSCLDNMLRYIFVLRALWRRP